MFTQFTLTRVLRTADLDYNNLLIALRAVQSSAPSTQSTPYDTQALAVVDRSTTTNGGRVMQVNILKAALVSADLYASAKAANPSVVPYIQEMPTPASHFMPQGAWTQQGVMSRALATIAPTQTRASATFLIPNEQQVTSWTAVAAGSINDAYFLISSTTTDYYVWFNVGSGGVDPALAGKTGVEVALQPVDLEVDVAQKCQAALSAVGSGSVFDVPATSTSTFVVTNVVSGTAKSAPDVGTSTFALVASSGSGSVTVGVPFVDATFASKPVAPSSTDGNAGTATYTGAAGTYVTASYVTQPVHPTIVITRQDTQSVRPGLVVENKTIGVLMNPTLAGLLGLALPSY